MMNPFAHNEIPISVEDMAKHFWLPENTNDLLKEISRGNEAAKIQLLIKFMPDVLIIAGEIIDNNMVREDVMRDVIRSFIDNIAYLSQREQIQKGISESEIIDDYLQLVKKQLEPKGFTNTEKVISARYNLMQITRLNELNNLLRKRQREIALQVEEYLANLENKLNGTETNLSNYEITVATKFYLLNSSQPIHSNIYYIDIKVLREFMEKFYDLNFDWKTDGSPILDNPFCYLLAELFERWQIAHCISEIAMVWTSISIEHQNCMLLKKDDWKFVSRYDF